MTDGVAASSKIAIGRNSVSRFSFTYLSMKSLVDTFFVGIVGSAGRLRISLCLYASPYSTWCGAVSRWISSHKAPSNPVPPPALVGLHWLGSIFCSTSCRRVVLGELEPDPGEPGSSITASGTTSSSDPRRNDERRFDKYRSLWSPPPPHEDQAGASFSAPASGAMFRMSLCR